MNPKRPLTFTLFLLRLLSGIAGGFSGTLMAFVVYFLMSTFIPAGTDSTSLSTFAIIIMTFMGTLTANTITALILTAMDSEKYARRKTTLIHVFLFNLVFFILTVFFYLLAIPMDIVIPVAALHFLISAFISALIIEIIASIRYSLLGVYSIAAGTLLSVFLGFVFLTLKGSPFFITLGFMPIVWFILMTTEGLFELIYDNYVRYYGVDALNSETDLGGDKEIEKEVEEEEDTDL